MRQKWFPFIAVAVIGIAAWKYMPAFWQLVQDREQLEAFVYGLGWMGPIALILFNALQIIVAPIPGYAVQIMAGFLFGTWWGGLWATFGLLLGSTTAMILARVYGRPLVARLVGSARLERWEQVTFSDKTVVWVILLAGPTGDLPYFLAGLSQVSMAKITMITFLIRVPSAFVTAAIGAGVLLLEWWHIVLIVVALAILSIFFLRYQDWLTGRIDQTIERQLPLS